MPEPTTYRQAVALSKRDRRAAEVDARLKNLSPDKIAEIFDAAQEAALFLIDGRQRRGDFKTRRARAG